MSILSIQSSVAYGHVGNSAAVFPLQRLGHEVWPVITVHFSNHTGYGAWRGPLLAPDDVREVITGIEERGVLGQADAVLSGYQGDPAVGSVILDAVARVKELTDGVGVDASGAVWYASVPQQHCVRVAEGGQVLETVPADRGCFSCTLGGEDGRTLFIVANDYGPEGASNGAVLTHRVDVPRGGRP